MRILLTLIALIPFCALGQAVHEAQYGVAETFNFVLFNTDGTLDVDEVDGGAEITADCDETPTNPITNDFVDEGAFYSIALTASEMECERVVLTIAATDTNVVIIETFGDVDAFDKTRGIASGMAQATDADASTIQLRSGHSFGNDVLNGMIVCVVSGAAVGECKIITDYDSASDEATIGPSNFSSDPTTTSAYIVYPAQASTLSQMYTYFYTTQTAVDLNDLQTELNSRNYADADDVTGLSGQITDLTDGTTPTWPLGTTIINGTADSGTTTTLTDAALTASTDIYRNGTRLTITSGNISGQSACVDTFSATVISFSPPMTEAISTNTYVLTADAGCMRGR